jgi:hypothetical protein
MKCIAETIVDAGFYGRNEAVNKLLDCYGIK